MFRKEKLAKTDNSHRQVKEYWENGDIPWVSSRDVKRKDIYDTERHITQLAFPNSSTKWIEKNAILFVPKINIFIKF